MSNLVEQDNILQFSVRKKRDRYRPLFCSSEFYVSNLSKFLRLKTILDTTLLGPHANLEKFVAYTLFLSLVRRPQEWFAQKSSQDALGLPSKIISNMQTEADQQFQNSSNYERFTPVNQFYITNFRLIDFLSIGEIALPKKLSPDMNLFDFVRFVRIKSIPLAAHWGLQFIIENPDRIVVTERVPEPLELLKIQTHGQRVISLIDQPESWTVFTHSGRDPLSFWLHDLVHLWEYFGDPENQNGQLQIYQFLQNLIDQRVLDPNLFHLHGSRHPLSEQLSYIISDMNSHPLHILKTLRATLDAFDSKIWSEIIEHTTQTLQRPTALRYVNDTQNEASQYGAMLQDLSHINALRQNCIKLRMGTTIEH